VNAQQLADKLEVHRTWIFTLRKKFPEEAPKTFDDVEGWKKLLDSTRKTVRVQPARSTKSTPELTDIARLTRGRADKVELENEILIIELDATKRKVIRQEEVITLFGQIASVVKGRLRKMANDLPSALLGLDSASIDRIVTEKLDYALSSFDLPNEFFAPKSRV
jgi:hypothetical protein